MNYWQNLWLNHLWEYQCQRLTFPLAKLTPMWSNDQEQCLRLCMQQGISATEARVLFDGSFTDTCIAQKMKSLHEKSNALAPKTSHKDTGHRKRLPWTAEEDEHIELGVILEKTWRNIASSMPTFRSDDSVRNRWNRLQGQKPGKVSQSNKSHNTTVKRLPWTPAEDAILRQMVASGNKRWLCMRELLPGRHSGAMRNRWKRLSEITSE